MGFSLHELFAQFAQMILMSAAMSASSFLCGTIPLSVQLSPESLRSIAVLSLGLLFGTSMLVILPEGVENVFKSDELERASMMVGILLLSGFVFMYIIDNLYLVGETISKSVQYTGMDAEDELQERPRETVNGSLVTFFIDPVSRVCRPVLSSSLTFGLIIHSITDGVVLTSSIFSHDESFNVIIFIAIFIHKLPTGFSLASILIAEGLPKFVVKLHLFIFSVSLMIGSIISFIAFQIFAPDPSSSDRPIAYLLMLSGGTFLYISVHTMTEVMGDRHQNERSLDFKEFGLMLLGFVLPTITLFFKE